MDEKKDSETHQAQDELRYLIDLLGWSQARAARYIFSELDEVQNPDEEDSFVSKFKKQLGRNKNCAEELRSYVRVIERSEEYKKKGLLTLRDTSLKGLSSEMDIFMKAFSAEILTEIREEQGSD